MKAEGKLVKKDVRDSIGLQYYVREILYMIQMVWKTELTTLYEGIPRNIKYKTIRSKKIYK